MAIEFTKKSTQLSVIEQDGPDKRASAFWVDSNSSASVLQL
jgi:hypothetical protein